MRGKVVPHTSSLPESSSFCCLPLSEASGSSSGSAFDFLFAIVAVLVLVESDADKVDAPHAGRAIFFSPSQLFFPAATHHLFLHDTSFV
jgi:hypothetical protein